MRIIFFFFSPLLLFVLQSAVLSRISIYGAAPNILLIFSVFLILYFTDYFGVIFFVFFSGFLLDMYSGAASGAVLISFALSVSVLYFLVNNFFNRGDFFIFCLIVALGSILYSAIYFIILNFYSALSGNFDFKILIMPLILNTLTAVLFYWPLKKILYKKSNVNIL